MNGAALGYDLHAGAQMDRLLLDFGQMYEERNRALEEVVAAHHDALYRLATAAEYKDDDTGVHIVRLGFLAERLALRLGQPRSWAALLRKAAPMHDIGKIGIADAILKKPGPLSPDERQIINGHPAIGAQILGRSSVPLFALAAEVALTHHERYDGLGYPNGLSGDAIPLGGRIVSVVDFFDALSMDRCYRTAVPDHKVRALLQVERGCAFDPSVVNALLSDWDQFVALRDHLTRTKPDFSLLAAEVGEIAAATERELTASSR